MSRSASSASAPEPARTMRYSSPYCRRRSRATARETDGSSSTVSRCGRPPAASAVASGWTGSVVTASTLPFSAAGATSAERGPPATCCPAAPVRHAGRCVHLGAERRCELRTLGPVHQRLAAETRPTRAFLAATAVITLAGAVLLVVQAEAIAHTVSGAFLHGATLGDLRGWLTLLVLAVIGRSALVWGQEWISHRSASAVMSDLRGRLLHAVARRGVGPGDRAAHVATVTTTGLDARAG